MKNFFFILIILSSNFTWAQIDYSMNAQSKDDIKLTRKARLNSVLEHFANEPLGRPPYPPKVGFFEFAQSMISRMHLRKDLHEVNQNILKEDFLPWASGTDIKVAGNVCKRVGDYDFVLMSLIEMAYIDHNAGETILSKEAREKLQHVLLNQTGNKHHIKFTLDNCIGVKIRDSENHILMTEISRYLTNQLLYKKNPDPKYDNEKNGFNTWFLEHLTEFLRTDFDELNSRPYQGYTLVALGVFYSHVENDLLKTKVRMILDYLSAKAAVQSIQMRRYAPFRRQLKHRDATNFMDTDNGMFWYAFKFADTRYMAMDKIYDPNGFDKNEYMYFMSAINTYEVPDLILDLVYSKEADILQTIKARDVEIYHRTPEFLLSSGGRHRNVFGYFTNENHVWALPTTIIPKSYGMKLSQVFSLRGEEKYNKRNNLCVHKNFACGKELKVPDNIPSECIQVQDQWTFYDLKNCSMNQGFYVATYEVDGYAFWEVRNSQESFESFKTTILKQNQKAFTLKGQNTYHMSNGHKISFKLKPKNLNEYPIQSVNDASLETDTEKWKLASGDLISSEGNGLITITHPKTGEKLILDDRNELSPQRNLVP